MKSITINTVQGIGDIFWVYQKLAPLFEEINVNVMVTAHNAIQHRSADFLKLLPKVKSVEFLLVDVKRYEAAATSIYDLKKVIVECMENGSADYAVNKALETGIRLEEIDSKLPVEWSVPIKHAPWIGEEKSYGVLYVSGSKPPIGAWDDYNWSKFVKQFYKLNELTVPLFLVGAEYDRKSIEPLAKRLQFEELNVTVMYPDIADTIGLIKKAKFFLGYQSGLNIIADNFDVPQVMLYFDHLKMMMPSWAKKENIEKKIHNFYCFGDGPETAAYGSINFGDGIKTHARPEAVREAAVIVPKKVQKIFIKCMQGIGDNIYARPFVRMLAQEGHDLYLHTVVPDIYSDLPVKFVNLGPATYRTQLKAQAETQVTYSQGPDAFDRAIYINYGHREIRKRNIIGCMEEFFGYPVGSTRYVFDLPKNLPYHGLNIPIAQRERVAIVRPVTHRKEWLNTSRPPKANYIGWCARMLQDAGYYVISVADTEPEQEWIDGDEPPANLKLHRGELGLYKTLSLFREAKVVVSGANFVTPVAIAAGAHLFTIFGGRGGYDNPHKLFDLRMNMKKIGWVIPDNFCRCHDMEHDCDKNISNLDSAFYSFMRSVE